MRGPATPSRVAAERGRFPRMRTLACLALLAAIACGGQPSGDRAPRPGAATEEWVTIEGIQFPAAMAEAPDEVIEAYVFAAKHPEVLRYMPCYCGCENPRFAHDSNYDCFVDAIDRGGEVPRVEPDPMGYG